MSADQSLLAPELAAQLSDTHNRLLSEGRLPSRDQLDLFYQRFKDEFGPAVLRGLDGPDLLNNMHNHSDRGSLVYWLEFKNDEELPAIFGSIAGGSALKFGIYRRSETGRWMVGPANRQRVLSEDEAVAIARRHRDQLIAGVALLDQLSSDATDEQYAELQRALTEAAPDVSDLAWGHKYFSLMFPTKLDDYHSPDYQQFHLIKLLQVPPAMPGRYASAGRFVAIARELDWPLNQLTTVLNKLHGAPYRYWRIGSAPENVNHWDEMREGSFIAIGWSRLPDLTGTIYNRESSDRLKAQIAELYPNQPQVTGNQASQVVRFCSLISEGDVVAVATGRKVHAIGRVTGPYRYVTDAEGCRHQRPVEWLHIADWELPVSEGLRMAVYQFPLQRNPGNLVEIERRILGAQPIAPKPEPRLGAGLLAQLAGIVGQVQRVLERKGQVILYGPPGTGKTYWAERAARELASLGAFGKPFDQLTEKERAEVTGDSGNGAGLVRMCCFHPAYGYEDFIEGYRPEAADGRLVFHLRDGIFKTLCNDAAGQPERRYYLIIDEINRGDIPRIFGELLSILEGTKRGRPILLPLTRSVFRVPQNVFVIGTMNTADRSIALLDTALRRRFGFVELMPDMTVLGNAVVRGVPLGPWLASLNRRICENLGHDARNLQIGHSYLMDGDMPIADFGLLKRALREDILPLLEEYCYDNYDNLRQILGNGLVDAANQRFVSELFEPGREDDLVRELLAPDQGIGEAAAALAGAEEPTIDDADAESNAQDDADQ